MSKADKAILKRIRETISQYQYIQSNDTGTEGLIGAIHQIGTRERMNQKHLNDEREKNRIRQNQSARLSSVCYLLVTNPQTASRLDNFSGEGHPVCIWCGAASIDETIEHESNCLINLAQSALDLNPERYEVKTVVQPYLTDIQIVEADRLLADYLNDGWLHLGSWTTKRKLHTRIARLVTKNPATIDAESVKG